MTAKDLQDLSTLTKDKGSKILERLNKAADNCGLEPVVFDKDKKSKFNSCHASVEPICTVVFHHDIVLIQDTYLSNT